MFLHQIFYQGLKARIASWPTLVLGKRQRVWPFSHMTAVLLFFVVNTLLCEICENITEKKKSFPSESLWYLIK